mmetsp:Transcript_30710/g.95467  ORF Transcript_30710/g.95467 Transcript_30710/m.95467 type:complete len:511 (-) Transcript_30710:423-1955(-)
MAAPGLAGKKVLIATAGSRGDVQPILALGIRLREAGAIVRFWINVNHADFFKAEGFDACIVNPDCDKVVREDPKAHKAMADGDAQAFIKLLGDEARKSFPESLEKKIADFKSWQPELVLVGVLDSLEVGLICRTNMVPCIPMNLSVGFPGRKQITILEEPAWAPHLTLSLFLFRMYLDTMKSSKRQELMKQLPECEPFYPEAIRELLFGMFHPVTPVLAGFSPTLLTIHDDWSKDIRERLACTGFWTLSPEMQEERLNKPDDVFFGGSERPALEEFLGGGPPPVYMGWGSMIAISPEHMTCFAVRALKETGMRGIVLGGWAELGIDKLAGQPDTEALVEYAQKNILFLKTAPHEVLFPKCSVLVHHGGSGTFACGVRSGTPSIITPVFLDQFLHARILNEHGVGIGLKQFGKLKVADLVKALKRCTTDTALAEKARKLGETTMAEDGVGNAVRVIDKFMVDEVATGKWLAAADKSFAKIEKMRQHPMRCVSWVNRLWCYKQPNEFDIDID